MCTPYDTASQVPVDMIILSAVIHVHNIPGTTAAIPKIFLIPLAVSATDPPICSAYVGSSTAHQSWTFLSISAIASSLFASSHRGSGTSTPKTLTLFCHEFPAAATRLAISSRHVRGHE